MKSDKMISIIVPAYNSGTRIEKCLTSLLQQTYKNLEVIVVDDGSQDNTGDIVSDLCKKDIRVRLIRQENSGAFVARIRGIVEATGEWVTFVDSDDWIEQGAYEEILEFNHDQADWVSYGYCTEFDDETIEYDYAYSDGIYPSNAVFRTAIYDENRNRPGLPQSIWSKIIKRKLLLQCISSINQNIRISLGDDAYLSYMTLLESQRICIYSKVFYHYMDVKGSLCKRENPAVFVELKNFIDIMNESIKKYPISWDLSKQLKLYMIHLFNIAMVVNFGFGFRMKYTFEDAQNLLRKRLVLYGAGKVGCDYVYQFGKSKDIFIKAWVDKNKAGTNINGYDVSDPQMITKLSEYDYIIIAVSKERIALEIMDELIKMGVDKNTIMWKRPVYGPPLELFNIKE